MSKKSKKKKFIKYNTKKNYSIQELTEKRCDKLDKYLNTLPQYRYLNPNYVSDNKLGYILISINSTILRKLLYNYILTDDKYHVDSIYYYLEGLNKILSTLYLSPIKIKVTNKYEQFIVSSIIFRYTENYNEYNKISSLSLSTYNQPHTVILSQDPNISTLIHINCEFDIPDKNHNKLQYRLTSKVYLSYFKTLRAKDIKKYYQYKKFY